MTRSARLVLALSTSIVLIVGREAREAGRGAPLMIMDQVWPHHDRGYRAAYQIVALATRAGACAAPLIAAHQMWPHPDRGNRRGCHAVTGP